MNTSKPPYRNPPPLAVEQIATLTVADPPPEPRDLWPVVGWCIPVLCFLLLLANVADNCKP